MNSVNIIGRLTKEPELRYTQSGKAVMRFTVAVNRNYSKDKRQEAEAAGQPTADFISCISWGKTAELIANYFNKGSQIGIEGRIQTGSYEKDGQRIYTTDVVVNNITFIGSSNNQSNNNYRPNNNYNQVNNGWNEEDENTGYDGFFHIDNNDIPF